MSAFLTAGRGILALPLWSAASGGLFSYSRFASLSLLLSLAFASWCCGFNRFGSDPIRLRAGDANTSLPDFDHPYDLSHSQGVSSLAIGCSACHLGVLLNHFSHSEDMIGCREPAARTFYTSLTGGNKTRTAVCAWFAPATWFVVFPGRYGDTTAAVVS